MRPGQEHEVYVERAATRIANNNGAEVADSFLEFL